MADAAIVVRELVKRYGDLIAVNGVSFEVNEGEVFSILGPNGAGKTTAVEMMECLRDPTSGYIEILGMNTKNRSRDIIGSIGVLPQKFDAYDLLTVRENIAYFAGMFGSKADVDSLIATVALEDKTHELFKNLSGGLKQRVGVAISLVNDPEIIFLDEPTTGLDPRARREVWQVIRDLRDRGKTVILTTHYMEEAEVLSDRVAIMNQGKFIALDSTSRILEKYGSGSVCTIKGGGEDVFKILRENGDQAELRNGDVVVKLENRRHLSEIVIALEERGAHYDEITVQHSNLEDVFLSLTGKKLVGGELINA